MPRRFSWKRCRLHCWILPLLHHSTSTSSLMLWSFMRLDSSMRLYSKSFGSSSPLCGRRWGWVAIRGSGATCAPCGGFLSLPVCLILWTKNEQGDYQWSCNAKIHGDLAYPFEWISYPHGLNYQQVGMWNVSVRIHSIGNWVSSFQHLWEKVWRP